MASEFVKGLLLSLLSPECYEEYFTKYNFLDVPCFKASLSKGLGIGIIAGSILVKVPQILKILNSKSAEGINFYGVCLELFAITANFVYSFVMGFPFSAWGEGTFLAIQTAIIAALVLYYGGSSGLATAFLGSYTGAVSALISGYTPTDILWSMQAATVPIILVAKFSNHVIYLTPGRETHASLSLFLNRPIIMLRNRATFEEINIISYDILTLGEIRIIFVIKIVICKILPRIANDH